MSVLWGYDLKIAQKYRLGEVSSGKLYLDPKECFCF